MRKNDTRALPHRGQLRSRTGRIVGTATHLGLEEENRNMKFATTVHTIVSISQHMHEKCSSKSCEELLRSNCAYPEGSLNTWHLLECMPCAESDSSDVFVKFPGPEEAL
eukprot:TRINITY_DN65061_c0_g1_i1.p2 TRINITY_DN65061_c0_g1~~TRINITY_DN65061_c0_g1_i1.p2  ORF type:complete len:109 (+),score=18.48 TRINITY_DN65061_c0_g1_i1:105-431(+)